MTNNDMQKNKDEIDFGELFQILMSKKLLVSSITLSAAIISVIYSLYLPNVYLSQSILSPASSQESLSDKLGAFSSFAPAIPGISLPKTSVNKSLEGIERIRSYDFFTERFLPNIQYENLVAAKRWNKANNTIIYDKKIFNQSEQIWSEKPTNQEAYETYTEILSVLQSDKTSLVSMSIEHVSPYIAEKWLNLIIKNINDHMREIDKNVARNSIEFLNISASNTNLAEIKSVIFKLMENQIQTLTLAESNEYYVFRPISSPIAPEKKFKPVRSIICILGTMLGLIIGIASALIIHYSKSKN